MRFEIWSNGAFTNSAIQWLKGQTLDFGGYSIGWCDGEAIKTYADQAKQASLRKILSEHYLRHPTAQAVRTARRQAEITNI